MRNKKERGVFMKAIVTDKFPINVPLTEDWKTHTAGDVVELSEKRLKELADKGFVRPYKEEKQIEIAKKEDKKETAKPKTRKKAK